MNKDLYFEYVEELVDFVIDELEHNEDKFVAVIAKFDEAKEILSNAMLCEDVNFDFLHIESPEVDDYNDEFVLSFWMNDGILEVGCEKLKDEAGDYICPCGDIVFLFSNCSSRIIPFNFLFASLHNVTKSPANAYLALPDSVTLRGSPFAFK